MRSICKSAWLCTFSAQVQLSSHFINIKLGFFPCYAWLLTNKLDIRNHINCPYFSSILLCINEQLKHYRPIFVEWTKYIKTLRISVNDTQLQITLSGKILLCMRRKATSSPELGNEVFRCTDSQDCWIRNEGSIWLTFGSLSPLSLAVLRLARLMWSRLLLTLAMRPYSAPNPQKCFSLNQLYVRYIVE